MVQVRAVDFQQVVIAAEDVGKGLERGFLLFEDPSQKLFALAAMGEGKALFKIMELDIIGSFVHHFQKS